MTDVNSGQSGRSVVLLKYCVYHSNRVIFYKQILHSQAAAGEQVREFLNIYQSERELCTDVVNDGYGRLTTTKLQGIHN